MPSDAGARLPNASMDRKTRFWREIVDRRDAAHILRREQLGVDAVDLHGVDGSGGDLHLRLAMADRHHAARREHDVVVQLSGQAFVEPMRQAIERDALRVEIVGADHRCVPPGIAAADPAFLEHRRAANSVSLGEIIGRRQTMAAAADDDGVVRRLGDRRAPSRRPATVAGQAFLQQRKSRVASGHRSLRLMSAFSPRTDHEATARSPSRRARRRQYASSAQSRPRRNRGRASPRRGSCRSYARSRPR